MDLPNAKTMDFPALDMASVPELEIDQIEQPWPRWADAEWGQPITDLDSGIRIAIPIHHTRDCTGIDHMAKAIGALPTESEDLRMWIGGQISMGHVIPAVLELAAPAVIERCDIATLTYSRANAEEWCRFSTRARSRSFP